MAFHIFNRSPVENVESFFLCLFALCLQLQEKKDVLSSFPKEREKFLTHKRDKDRGQGFFVGTGERKNHCYVNFLTVFPSKNTDIHFSNFLSAPQDPTLPK